MNRQELDLMQKYLLEDLVWFDRICMNNGISYSLAYGTLLGAIRHGGFIPWDDDVDIIMTRENYELLMEKSELVSDKYRKIENYKNNSNLYIIYGHLSDNRARVYSRQKKSNKDCLHIDISVCDFIPEHINYRQKINSMLALYYTRLFAFRKGQFATSGKMKGIKEFVLKLGNRVYSNYSDECLEKIILSFSDSRHKSKLMAPIASPYGYINELFPKEYYEQVTRINFEGELLPVFTHYNEILTKRYGDYSVLPPEETRYIGIENLEFEIIKEVK